MELRHIEYFIVVAEELNFGRAAARLQMTQPPLSQQIIQLEKELGVQLFQRTKRKVELTLAGNAFLEEARKILHQVDFAIDITRRAAHGETGQLKVGFVGSATYDILPIIVREYRAKYPDVNVSLSELSSPAQLDALVQKQIDVGIIRPPVGRSDLSCKIVQESRYVLALPQNHPLLVKDALSLQDAENYPFVFLARKTWPRHYDEILGLCSQLGFHPVIVQEALEFQTVIGLVAAGIGIALVPTSAKNLHTKEVVYRDIVGPTPVATMGIAWRNNELSVPVHEFVRIAEAWEHY